MSVVRRENRGARAVGPGVIEAFYAGLTTVNLDDFEYLCKIDSTWTSLTAISRHWSSAWKRTRASAPAPANPTSLIPDGRLVSEGCGDETSVGMTKFYRVECFRQIGGFVRQVMWDGIDNHRCRMLGWKAASWDESRDPIHAPSSDGSSHKGILTGRMRHGFGQYSWEPIPSI